MASNEETMRLNAELSLAKFSPQAKQMVKDLAEIKKATDEAHSPAAKVAKLHAKAYQELREKIGGTAETIRGILSPSMAALGITGFAAGEALGSMVEKIKDAAKNYNILNDVSRRSGMSVDTINAVSIAFQRLGQDGPQAIQSMAEFGEAMAKFDRNSPAERLKWAGAYADVIDQLGNKMKGKSRLEQLDEAFKFNQRTDVPLDIKRDIDQNLLHLDPSIATKTGQELREALQKGFAYEKEHPDNPILNKAAADAMADLNESMAGFKDNMFEAFGGPGIWVIEGMTARIERLNTIIKELGEGKIISDDSLLGRMLGRDKQDKTDLDDAMRDEAEKNKQQKLRNQNERRDSDGRFKPIAFHPDGGSSGGGGGSQAEDMLAKGVKSGMLAAFREWFSSVQSAGGGAGGMQNVNYPTGGPASTRSAAAIAASFGNKDYPNNGTGNGGPNGVAPSENNDASLTGNGGPLGGFDRSRFVKELATNPALRDRVMRIASNEQGSNRAGTQAVIESMMNRANMRGTSLAKEAHWVSEGGYYANGSLGRGALENSKSRDILENSLKNALGGADTIGLATDNSSGGLAEREAASGKFIRHGRPINGESFFHPGWAEPKYRDRWLAMKASRDLLANSKAANINGGPQKVEGDAHLKVDLNGLPKGSTADLSYNGLFKGHTLTRGFQMQPATRE
jgi:hypothetical protein